MITLKDFEKSKYPFEDYLENIHASDYMGTDDDMPDDFERFITELEPEDLIKHANVFSKLLLEVITKV